MIKKYGLNSLLLLFLLSGITCTAQTTKEEFIQLGLKQDRNHNYDEAIALFGKALEIDPSSAIAYAHRSESYLGKKDFTNALTDANKAIEIDPKNVIAHHHKGLILKEQGKYDEAIAAYNKAISLDKNYFYSYADKIHALLAAKRPAEAKMTAENLKKELPKESQSYIVAFIYYAWTNDTQNALKELDNAVNTNPKDDEALDHRARYKDEIGDNKGAIADFNKLIALKPDKAAYYYNRSSANYDLKNYDAVIADCKKAVSLDDNYYEAYTMLGNVYDIYGDTKQSVANYERAISIRPNQEFAYNELGKTYFAKDDYTNALNVFNRILERNPNTVSSLEYHAGCCSKLGYHNRAIEDYTKLISLFPDSFENYMNRANEELVAGKKTEACTDMNKGAKMVKKRLSEEYLYAHTFLYKNCRELFSAKMLKVNDLYEESYNLYTAGKVDQTIKKYDEMIKIIPDSAYLYYNRGKFKQELNQHEAAILDYKKAVQLDKKNVESWVAMGISYMYIRKFDDAIKSFLEAIKADENYAMSYNNIAQVYREKKDNANALKYLEIAVQKDPLYKVAYFSLGEIYADIGNKEKACYNFKRAEALGEPKARIKILSECSE